MAVDLGPTGTFEGMLALARKKGRRRCVVACGEDCAAIEALAEAEREGIVTAVLYGDEQRITTICASLKVDPARFEIHHRAELRAAVDAAVRDAADNGDFLMKGQVDSATFLKGVLADDSGLRDDRILSHVAYLELPSYHKALAITDGGINAELDLKRKIDIVRNAVELSLFFGNSRPKVALLSAVERIKLNIAETLDWAIITRMGEQGEFGEALVEGPLAVDVALSAEAARVKRIASEVAGDVDILVVPSMATGNVLAKGLQYLGGAKACGLVVGARRPIVMLSRADTSATKLYSIAMGNLVSWR
ncbi:MAG TPA: bifunctional enoyl-CoA hydratase/phosphate acetyltransferase [candidate division WOR-3 bacterium]|mgnify:CR=1 FL=1|uniref:Bifunctional enoyl-CoA hydratase/phosphate acetyltransferase n=1 Tax=candidate division WOR-3 bacterium TaxID=2052148 RepID=A0A7V0XG31_UNCW3|nr:bifunctional enoyl-CoA hydratase/phosphate acetyltransferase [candidate division WOR-3 bacterium]